MRLHVIYHSCMVFLCIFSGILLPYVRVYSHVFSVFYMGDKYTESSRKKTTCPYSHTAGKHTLHTELIPLHYR